MFLYIDLIIITTLVILSESDTCTSNSTSALCLHVANVFVLFQWVTRTRTRTSLRASLRAASCHVSTSCRSHSTFSSSSSSRRSPTPTCPPSPGACSALHPMNTGYSVTEKQQRCCGCGWGWGLRECARLISCCAVATLGASRFVSAICNESSPSPTATPPRTVERFVRD